MGGVKYFTSEPIRQAIEDVENSNLMWKIWQDKIHLENPLDIFKTVQVGMPLGILSNIDSKFGKKYGYSIRQETLTQKIAPELDLIPHSILSGCRGTDWVIYLFLPSRKGDKAVGICYARIERDLELEYKQKSVDVRSRWDYIVVDISLHDSAFAKEFALRNGKKMIWRLFLEDA